MWSFRLDDRLSTKVEVSLGLTYKVLRFKKKKYEKRKRQLHYAVTVDECRLLEDSRKIHVLQDINEEEPTGRYR